MRAQSGFSPANLVRASFKQFQAEAAIPAARRRLRELTEEIEGMHVEGEDAIVEYLGARRKLCGLEGELRARVFRAKHVLRFMQPGRLVRVLPDVASSEVPVFLAYPEELRHSKRVSVFRDFVQEEIVIYRRNMRG